MKTNSYLLIVLCLLISLSACRKDSYQEFTENEGPDGQFFRVANLAGLVKNENDLPLEGAKVVVGTEQTFTDQNGIFQFSGIEINSKGSLITVEKLDYFSGYTFVYTKSDAQNYVEVKLLEKKIVAEYSSSEPIDFQVGDISVSLPSEAWEFATGTQFNGTVQIVGAAWDPLDPEITLSMPGDLRGIDGEGNQTQLASYGMFGLEVSTLAGQPLFLRTSSKAEITFPLAQELKAVAPATIPMWHFNETSGYWEEEGEATLNEDGDYTTKLTHFSFWNCDDNFDLSQVTARLVDGDGNPIHYEKIIVRIDGTNITSHGWTDVDGYVQGGMPVGVPLTMFVYTCDEETVIHEFTIEEGSTSKDLGDIVYTDAALMKISTILIDCNMMVPENAYLIITQGEDGRIVFPDSNGAIDYYFNTNCSEDSIRILGFDPDLALFSQEIVFSPQMILGDQDLDPIIICEESETGELIIFNFGEIDNFITHAKVQIVDDSHYFIHSEVPDPLRRFEAYLEMTSVGGFGLNDGRLNLYGPKQENIISSGIYEEIQVSFEEMGDVGEVLKGTIIDNEGTMESSFDLVVDERVFSGDIQVNVWYDENDDGIWNNGELAIPCFDLYISLGGVYASDYFGERLEGISDENGIMVFDQVPVDSTIRVVGSNQQAYILSDGEDFFLDQTVFKTDFFELSSGELKEFNLGLIPENLTIRPHVKNCPSEIELDLNIEGGIPPYKARINGGEYEEGKEIIFTNLSAGDYFIEIEDQIGIKLDTLYTVTEDRAEVYGFFWTDQPNNSHPNTWASGEWPDQPILIELVDMDLNIVDSIWPDWDVLDYKIDSIPPGEYMIRAEITDAYEFVIKHFSNDETSHSDINPDSGLSDSFILDCNDQQRINIGYKVP